MNIYKVQADLSYRLMYPEDDIFESEHFEFKAKSIKDILPQFEAYFDPASNKPLPDIAFLGMATFAFSSKAAERLVEILECAGELLPIRCNNELWYCLNVTKTYEAVGENAKFEHVSGNVKLNLKEADFVDKRIGDTSLFKIPDDNFTDINCTDRRSTDDDVLHNFMCAVEGNNLKGLKFEMVQ